METPSPRNVQRFAAALLGAGVLSLVLFLGFSGSARRAELKSRRAAFASVSKGLDSDGARVVRLDVEGMTCEGCAASVQEELSRVAGVTSCRVDLSSEVAEVRLASADIPTDVLLAAVHDAGYEARLEPGPPAAP